jgi:hypothetical protein
MDAADRDTVGAVAFIEAVSVALRAKILGSPSGPRAFILSQCARVGCLDSWIHEFASGAVQPAVRARAFRWLFLGRTEWVVERRWTWTDLAFCKQKCEPVLGSRGLPARWGFAGTLEAAMGDRSPMVRRVAGEFLIRELPSLGKKALRLSQRMAADPNPAVAELGRFALKQVG